MSTTYSFVKPELLDVGGEKKILESFKAASQMSMVLSGYADSLLQEGRITCSDVLFMFRKGTGWQVPDRHVPYEEYSKFVTPKWGFRYSKRDAWAYWTARFFWEVCRHHKLGIKAQ